VIDIGCAPGGWSEVAVGLVKSDVGRVIGIDLLPVKPPVAGATLLQGDFTDPKTRAELLRLATAPVVEEEEGGGRPVRVDVVLSDLAPNFTGDSHTDHVRTLSLCYEVCEKGLKIKH
jgi:23S rRNA (uridine2552-2'-O)-methyltransferase